MSITSRRCHATQSILVIMVWAAFAVTSPLATAQVAGIVEYVPNGGFERLSRLEVEIPSPLLWRTQYLGYALHWRHFTRYFLSDPYPLAPTPANEDRYYYLYPLRYYDPISCSSPDLFSYHLLTCDPNPQNQVSVIDIPENTFGFQEARLYTPDPGVREGRYAGLYYRLNAVVNENGQPKGVEGGNPATDYWREYLQVELVKPLIANQTYVLSYWVSIADASNRSIDLETRISTQPYYSTNLAACAIVADGQSQDARVGIPQTAGNAVIHRASRFLFNEDNWVHVTAPITAAGGERYLSIGNWDANPLRVASGDNDEPPCLPDYQDEFTELPLIALESAYFYVDDVSLYQTVTCECGTQVCFYFERVQGSPQECCYRIVLVNGHNDYHGPAKTGCSIYSLEITDPGSPAMPLYTWTGSPQEPAIPSDGQRHTLGTLCIPAFSKEVTKLVEVKVRNQAGEVFCEQEYTIRGCTLDDECSCEDFQESVRITATSGSGEDCCFGVFLDASLLSCQISSIKIYRGQEALPATEIEEAHYQPASPVSTTHTGMLYEFCNDDVGESDGGVEALYVQFLNAQGESICETTVLAACECNCETNLGQTPEASAELIPVSAPTGQCCFEVRVANTGSCRIKVGTIKIKKAEGFESAVSASGWSFDESEPGYVIATPELGPLYIYGDEPVLLGTLCVEPCVAYVPQTITISIVDESAYPVCGTTFTATAPPCSTAFDCDNFEISGIYTRSGLSSDGSGYRCCAKFGGRVLGCDSYPTGMFIKIESVLSTQTLPILNFTDWTWSSELCVGAHQGFATVQISLCLPDSTVVCTKSIQLGPCPGQGPPPEY